jgi:uncharacterized cupin superfamily protein
MTCVAPIPHHPTFAPREDRPMPERLISGSPEFRTWALDEALAEAGGWGRIRTGIWEATPGVTQSIKGETFEFCHLIAGRVEITGADGVVQSFAAGDSFVMKPGFVGQWKTLETVKKIYVVATRD